MWRVKHPSGFDHARRIEPAAPVEYVHRSDTFIHVSGTSASCRGVEVVYFLIHVYHNVLIPGSEGNG